MPAMPPASPEARSAERNGFVSDRDEPQMTEDDGSLRHVVLFHAVLLHAVTFFHGAFGHRIFLHHRVLGHGVLFRHVVVAHLVLGEGSRGQREADRKGCDSGAERDPVMNGHVRHPL